jgi:hypothetical protein
VPTDELPFTDPDLKLIDTVIKLAHAPPDADSPERPLSAPAATPRGSAGHRLWDYPCGFFGGNL